MSNSGSRTNWIDVLPWLDRADFGSMDWSAPLPHPISSVMPAQVSAAADIAITKYSAWPLANLFPGIQPDAAVSNFGFSVRARNVLEREGAETFSGLAQQTIRDLFLLRNSGAVTVQVIIERLIAYSITSDRELLPHGLVEGSPASDSPSVPLLESGRDIGELLQSLQTLAVWNIALGHWDRPLLAGDAFRSAVPISVQRARETINLLTARSWFESSETPAGLADVLAAQLAALTEREVVILSGRLLAERPMTLDRLGALVGVTRERIRQIESKLMTKLSSWLDLGSDLVIFSLAVRNNIGRLSRLDRLLERMPHLTHEVAGVGKPAWYVLDKFDDTFESDGVWIAEPSLDELRAETTLRFQQAQAGPGVASFVAFREATLDWTGVNDSDIADWLVACGYRRVEDHYLSPSIRSVPDVANAFLLIRGVACAIGEIHSAVVPDRSIGTLQNALTSDERFVRVNRSDWGLKEWGAREYSGIRDAIEMLVRDRGSIALDELIADLTSSFSVSPRSIVAYASMWPFSISDGVVRIATAPKTPRKTISQTRNVYRPSSGVLAFRIRVTGDHLRGSGSPIPASLGAALGLAAGEKVSLTSPNGVVVVSWTGSQPALGSIRGDLLAIDGAIGDELLVYIGQGHLHLERLKAADSKAGAIRSLMGLRQGGELLSGEIAAALGLSVQAPWSTVIHLLRDRGEGDIADLIVDFIGHNPAFDLSSKHVARSKFAIVSIDDN